MASTIHPTQPGWAPGPWTAVDLRSQKNGQIRIDSYRDGYYEHVANVLARSRHAEGNARLIAAAPELRELLEYVYALWRKDHDGAYIPSVDEILERTAASGEIR
ncbi:MAG: hypothetical protein IRY83_03980 [Chloroflexi bacterium]|nr:hypothetical protein [Chloroflexota bacterium]